MKKFLLGVLYAVLWITDFENILVFILIPAGLIALGVIAQAGWLYYPTALGIYAASLWILDRMINILANAGIKAASGWLKKRRK